MIKINKFFGIYFDLCVNISFKLYTLFLFFFAQFFRGGTASPASPDRTCLVLKYTLIVFRSNWWCPAGVKSTLINKIVVYNLRLTYMPDKLVAILFYRSLNAKSSEFLLSSLLCDFHPKHGLKQFSSITYTGETSLIADKKSSENLTSGLEDSWIYPKIPANS